MHHPNVLNLHEVFEDSEKIFLVLELAAGGDLFERMIGNEAPSPECRPCLVTMRPTSGAPRAV